VSGSSVGYIGCCFNSPPGPFLCPDVEVDGVGGIWCVEVVQVRLVEHVLSGLTPARSEVFIDVDRRGKR
jgi:hypothetical protein